MMIDIRQPGWVGCALAFLALCKVGFVSGFGVPCNVLKIAWGSVGKVIVCVDFYAVSNRVLTNVLQSVDLQTEFSG